MLRADYCGNGQPGTINGWLVNVYDDAGVQADTENDAQWVFEAEWSASGAICVDEYRALELVVSGDVPACALEKINDDCGDAGFVSGTLLMSEYNSSGVIPLVRNILNGNPNKPVADKVEDALAKLEDGFASLAETPADREQAAADFESASGDLDAAFRDRLLSASYGKGLLNRIAAVARSQATSARTANACAPRHPPRLADSLAHIATGDLRRAAGRYKDACAAYKSAVILAEDAAGRPCTP
jgi:ADYC domain